MFVALRQPILIRCAWRLSAKVGGHVRAPLTVRVKPAGKLHKVYDRIPDVLDRDVERAVSPHDRAGRIGLHEPRRHPSTSYHDPLRGKSRSWPNRLYLGQTVLWLGASLTKGRPGRASARSAARWHGPLSRVAACGVGVHWDAPGHAAQMIFTDGDRGLIGRRGRGPERNDNEFRG